MASIKLDFRVFFAREARRAIIPSYKRLITVGRGVEQDNAPTKKKPNRRKWMNATGELRDKGFSFIATKNRLIVFPTKGKHSGKGKQPSYRELFTWHNRGLSSYNNQRYSGLFEKLPVGSQFPKRFKEEAMRQINKKVGKELLRGL